MCQRSSGSTTTSGHSGRWSSTAASTAGRGSRRSEAGLRNDCGLLALWRPSGEPELEFVGLFLGYARTEIARSEAADWIADRLTRACADLGTAVERTSERTLAVNMTP
jgi:hypothetical protein